MTDQTETARELLWRHQLPEDVIDGALCLHAQELAAVQRRDAAVWGVDTAAGKHVLAAADLIDPTKTAAAVPSAVPAPATDRAGLREQIATAVDGVFEAWRDGLGDVRPQDALVDAVLPLVPASVDRAAEAEQGAKEGFTRIYRRSAAKQVREWGEELRRLTVEARDGQTTHDEAPQGATRRGVEYFLQSREADGVWEDSSGFMVELDFAAERLAKRRCLVPGFEYRIAQRTTTVSVQPLPDCLNCRHWMCNGDGPCGALLDSWQRCTCTQPAGGAQQPKEAHP